MKAVKETEEREFRRGYYLAVATLLRQHGAALMGEDVLRAYGPVNFDGIDPYVLRLLKPIAAEITRKASLSV
jgi:hypothetical protein